MSGFADVFSLGITESNEREKGELELKGGD